jgi:hypothetical protein
MSTKCPVFFPNETDNQFLPDREKRHQRFAAVSSLLRDRLELMDTRWAENNYWDRAAPRVFGLFMASLITLLVLSYAGVLIV